MALSNSQYDQLMRTYELRQLDNEHRLRQHYDTVYREVPQIRRLDDEISALSVAQARRMLGGDVQTRGEYKQRLFRLISEKRRLLVSAGFSPDYLEMSYTCPDCKDTGYIETEKCHCLKKAIVDFLYAQSNLSEALARENFSTFSLDYYSSGHKDPLTGRSSLQAAQTALQASRAFVDTFGESFQNILFYGDTGVGKTFLSHCIAKELMDAQHSVLYFSATRLFDCFAKAVFGGREADAQGDLEHIYGSDLLIIDDLGTELPNNFTVSQLFACLNERILRKKPTIISTNLALEDIKTIYSERIFSRISSSYTMLRLTGDDIRIQKKLFKLGGTKDATS